MGTFFRPQVYKRAGISSVEVNKRVGKSVILPPFPLPQTNSRLASLADFFFRPQRFFCPFSPNAEPGPRLGQKGLADAIYGCEKNTKTF